MSAPVTSHRKFLNNPNSFYYICGSFTILSQRANISALVKQAYFAYFKLNFGDQDKPYGPLSKCTSHVSKVYRCGRKEHVKSSHLVYSWFGESKKIIAQTVTFV